MVESRPCAASASETRCVLFDAMRATIPLRLERRIMPAMLIDSATLATFLVASLALLVLPGPSVMYVVALSLQRGRRAGFASVLGVGLGAYLQFIAAALGLAALLATSATAFAIVKWAGAAYLVFIGIRTLLEPSRGLVAEQPRRVGTLLRIGLQGTIVTVLNPKLALFVLAFVPQFLDPARGSVTLQVLLLGAAFVVLAAVTDGAYALGASWIGRQLRRHPAAGRAQRWLSGGVYIALGVSAVTANAPSSAAGRDPVPLPR